ncbi:ribosomal protein L16 [Pneumocystis carinii B80]|uniref:Ribosomal protein L16 n=1 Tax=Pneumocystis carinii (strain B80) TaxID=1408658 RepID=A0A0W4ZJD4_PNEC8|nr:ribosomal protein L16 [Pneumocystis carinii B80]KTW28480.1 ribosomal protein L16 [Pneumocystis carinii B80]
MSNSFLDIKRFCFPFFPVKKCQFLGTFLHFLIPVSFDKYLYDKYVIIRARNGHQYAPRRTKYKKAHKGRIPVPIGMSIKGTTVVYGDFGMRLKDQGVRFSAKQLQTAEMLIKKAIKPFKGSRIYTRVSTNIAVCIKGNESRMGKGKGSFDHWAVRVPVGRVVFEIGGGGISSEAAMEALRKAGYKLPGKWEIIKRDAPGRIGLHYAPDKTLSNEVDT